MRTTRRILASLALAAAVLAAAVTAATGSETKPVVLNVGDTQGIDSMNPIVGVTVPAYEAWNLQYATLTDKAAKDFATTPGLAQSWKGSPDGKTWTYTLRRAASSEQLASRLAELPGFFHRPQFCLDAALARPASSRA